MYSFYLTRKPVKSIKRRYDFAEYTNSEAMGEPYLFSGDDRVHDAQSTAITQLKLNLKDKLYYLFDFGDSWWHEITLLSIKDLDLKSDKGYPKIIKKVGKSPPQYYFDDEEY